jgi:TPR repeat protein
MPTNQAADTATTHKLIMRNLTRKKPFKQLASKKKLSYCQHRALLGQEYVERANQNEHKGRYLTAAKYWHKAFVLNNPLAQQKFQRLTDANAIVEKVQAISDPMNFFNKGIKFLLGLGGILDTQQAFDHFSHGAKNGHAPSMYFLAQLYFQGIGVSQDENTAIYWLEQAALKNYTPAQTQFSGFTADNDEYRSIYWLSNATSQADTDAYYYLAKEYQKSKDPKKHNKVVSYLEYAATHGNTKAQYHLSERLQEQGNYEQAKQHLTDAAKRGFNKAQLMLGSNYLTGANSYQCDINKAIFWLEKAAKHNMALAYYNLGECYRMSGPQNNISKAFTYYRQGAHRDEPNAQYELAECYRFGRGVDKDLGQAARFYRKACEYTDGKFPNISQSLNNPIWNYHKAMTTRKLDECIKLLKEKPILWDEFLAFEGKQVYLADPSYLNFLERLMNKMEQAKEYSYAQVPLYLTYHDLLSCEVSEEKLKNYHTKKYSIKNSFSWCDVDAHHLEQVMFSLIDDWYETKEHNNIVDDIKALLHHTASINKSLSCHLRFQCAIILISSMCGPDYSITFSDEYVSQDILYALLGLSQVTMSAQQINQFLGEPVVKKKSNFAALSIHNNEHALRLLSVIKETVDNIAFWRDELNPPGIDKLRALLKSIEGDNAKIQSLMQQTSELSLEKLEKHNGSAPWNKIESKSARKLYRLILEEDLAGIELIANNKEASLIPTA